MKNIFNYAKKEFSQDAFWLCFFDSYKENDVGDFAKKFLLKMIGETIDSKITDLKTSFQCKEFGNVDVLIECKIDDKYVVIAIEDKVDTEQHSNQLEREAKAISKKYDKYYLIYCKTRYVSMRERRDIERINRNLNNIKNKWRIFDYNDIKQIFDEFYKIGTNYLIDMYYSYICEISSLYNIEDNERLEWIQLDKKWWVLFDEACANKVDLGSGKYISYYYKHLKVGDREDFFSVELRSKCFNLQEKTFKFNFGRYVMPNRYMTSENMEILKKCCLLVQTQKPYLNIKLSQREDSVKEVASMTIGEIETANDFKNAVKQVIDICSEIYSQFEKYKKINV